jgi:type IV pilus assembly protein PilC
MVVNMSQWLKEWWWIVLGSIIVSAYVFGYFKKRSTTFNHFLDSMLLKMPVVGIILRKSAIARFARTLSTMSAAGVPLVDALQSVAGACGNNNFAQAVLKMREEVATGQRLQFAMMQTNLFLIWFNKWLLSVKNQAQWMPCWLKLLIFMKKRLIISSTT